MSKAESTRQLTGFLAYQLPNHKARDALSSMREVIWTPGWGPDTLIKILPDMDEAFFNGLLRQRVQVSWEDEASVQHPATQPAQPITAPPAEPDKRWRPDDIGEFDGTGDVYAFVDRIRSIADLKGHHHVQFRLFGCAIHRC